MYSPISPILSPVVFAYPVMYPTLSPPQPFAIPATTTHLPAGSPDSVPTPHTETPQNACTYPAHPSMPIAPIPPAQSCGLPYPYSPHRVVDGTTLSGRDGTQYGEGFLHTASRAVVRPVSTPPTPIQGSDAGVARVREFFFASRRCLSIC